MNLHQFRFVQEAARRNLNLTEAAKALHTSQPGVSKAIIELEGELGIEIFARHGKRLRRITEPGQHVIASIELIMREVGNLKRIGDEYAMQDAGTLSIATTHTQARYVLPQVVTAFKRRFPRVHLKLHQGSPDEIARMLIDGQADIGIATETLAGADRASRISSVKNLGDRSTVDEEACDTAVVPRAPRSTVTVVEFETDRTRIISESISSNVFFW